MTAIEKFLGMMIVKGSYTFDEIVSKRPDLKEGIVEYLNSTGNSQLITERNGE